ANSNELRQLESSIRSMFVKGEISAEQFAAAMAKVKEAQKKLKSGFDDTATAASKLQNAVTDALREAANVGDVVKARRLVQEAFQAGILTLEEYARLLELIEEAEKNLAASGPNAIQAIW